MGTLLPFRSLHPTTKGVGDAGRPPDDNDLGALAERYRLRLSDADRAAFSPFVTGLLGSSDVIAEFYSRTAPKPRDDRKWYRPDEAENPLGAWYVRTEITEGDDGPLAGRTVAVKDNTMVAGVPMMNGSDTVEGLRPGPREHGASNVRHPVGS